MNGSTLEVSEILDGYLSQSDWRVRENSNVGFSLGGLILHNAGSVTARYWLERVYSPEIAEAHRSAAFHIHDLSMLSGYCAGWSLGQLIREGLGGVSGKITGAPAKHLFTMTQQMVNFLGIMQNEWAGAQAFASFDTLLAPFVRADKLDYESVKRALQSFVFGVNTPSRWGCQAPFTNITLDWTVPADLRDRPAVVGGVETDFTYGDCQAEMDLINRAFIELMLEGDAQGRGFQYPIPTYNITRDFDWTGPNAKLLFEMTAKYGTPYFQNFVNSDLDPGDVRSMCCRLRLDKRELRKRGGGLFGSDEFTGSIGVVTINLPQIAYLADNDSDFFARLDRLMDLAAESLEMKRRFVAGLLDKGLFPYTRRYLKHFDNHFSTIGICGMNEATLNLFGIDLRDPAARNFAARVLTHMRDRLADYQEKTGSLFNLEATPAESTSYRLASHDKRRFPDIVVSGENDPYYTNSTQLPVDSTPDIFDALDAQDELQTLYTGGTVFHGFLGEAVDDWRACAALVRTISETYRIPYFTLTPRFSICAQHGYIKGEAFSCPHCGGETEVYTRIVGYYRAVQNWNRGKREEYRHRVMFGVPEENSGDERAPAITTGIAEQAPVLVRPAVTALPQQPVSDLQANTRERQTIEYYFRGNCTLCPPVAAALKKSGVRYTTHNVDDPAGYSHAAAAEISSLPTVLFRDVAGVETARVTDVHALEAQLRPGSADAPAARYVHTQHA